MFRLMVALSVMSTFGCSKSSAVSQTRQAECEVTPAGDGGEPEVIGPPMTSLRQLRRMTLVPTNRLPTREKITALAAITDETAQKAWLAEEFTRLLNDPLFYDSMVDFGHAWMNIPPVANIADQPEYGLPQQRAIIPCPAGTLHAGKWGSPNAYSNFAPPSKWWASTVTRAPRSRSPVAR